MSITAIGVTIAPTPGAFGVYHSFAQITLSKFYGVPPEIALAYAAVAHGIGYIVQIVVGGAFFIREHFLGITWNSVAHAGEEEERTEEQAATPKPASNQESATRKDTHR
jgi:hypothetical protein